MGWAFRLTWQTDARHFSGVIGANVLKGLLPAALALAGRGLVNEVVDSIDRGFADNASLFFWLGLGLLLTATNIIAVAVGQYFNQRLSDEMNLQMTSDILAHAAKLDYAYFEDPRFQDVLHRAQQNPAQAFDQFLYFSISIITNLIQIVSLVTILLVIDPIVALLLVPPVIPYMIFHWRLARKRFEERYSRATKNRWTSYFTNLVTSENYVAETKLLDLAPLLIQRFQKYMTEFRDRDRHLYLANFWGKVVFAALTVTAVYLAIARVVLQAIAGALTVGDVTVYVASTSRLRVILESVIGGISNLRERSLDVSNLITFFELKPEKKMSDGIVPARSQGEIEFRDVCFSYPGTGREVLTDVSLHILPGETVALVGENGAGKTTLVKLIARLYDPDQGCILFDEQNLKTLSLEYLRQQISFVFQRFGRYEATVAENIAYADWRRLLDNRERVQELGRLSGVHEMVEAMPQGYDTLLGRLFGEYNLSGGQWQKIAISRAFARDSALVILDEPTANLDARAEYDLYSRFKRLAAGRTTILISHRFSTVSMADRILVMDKGRIIERGTHEQLLADDRQYANLFRLHQQQMNLSTNGSMQKESDS